MKSLIPFTLNKELLAIDFGNHSIKIIVGKLDKGKVIASKAITLPISHEYYADGRILNVDGLKDAIGKALKEHKISAKSIICTLESTFVITREIILPAVQKEDLYEMVQYEIGELLPNESNQYVIQHKIVEEFVDEGVNKYRLLVAALPAEIASGFFKLIESLDLTPVALNLHSIVIGALLHGQTIVNGREVVGDKAVAIVDLGYNQINVVITENGVYKFSRIINAGASNIPDHAVGEADMYQGFQEAAATSHSTFNVENASMNDVVKMNVDFWFDEINRVFKYYTSRSQENVISKILIYGGGSCFGGLANYMGDVLQIPVTRVDHVDHVELHERSGSYPLFLNTVAAIVGANKDEAGVFNFFQPYIKEPEKTNVKRLAVLSLATVIGFYLVFYPAYLYMQTKSLKNEIASLQQVIESPENLQRVQVIEGKEEHLQTLLMRQEFLHELDLELQSKEKIDDVLFRNLHLTVPDGVYFNTVTLDNQQINISGHAIDRMVIAQMEYNLRQSAYFDQVFVSDIVEAEGQCTFSVTFAMKDVISDDAQ